MFEKSGATIQTIKVGACQGCVWNNNAYYNPKKINKCLSLPAIFNDSNNSWYQGLSNNEQEYWDNYFTVGISIDTTSSSTSDNLPDICWENNRSYTEPDNSEGNYNNTTSGNNVQYIEIGLNPSSVILNMLSKFKKNQLLPFGNGNNVDEWTVTIPSSNVSGSHSCHSSSFSTYSECYTAMLYGDLVVPIQMYRDSLGVTLTSSHFLNLLKNT